MTTSTNESVNGSIKRSMKRPVFSGQKAIDSILRVDHAGEYGAVRIYQGQIDGIRLSTGNGAFNSDSQSSEQIKHMKAQEEEHLAFFENEMRAKRVRPTIFQPLWHNLGYGLGYVTSFFGSKYAMICTDAVESVIEKHYQSQIDYLEGAKSPEDSALRKKLITLREEEIEHKDLAIDSAPVRSSLDKVISSAISSLCHIAISMSKRF